MRRKATVGACLLLLVLVFSAYIFRETILTAAGRLLVVANPVTSADVIVVAVDARKVGILDAADLFHQGVAPQVAVFATYPDEGVDKELIKRGVPYFDIGAWSVRALKVLGVTHVMLIPQEVLSTEHQGNILLGWLKQHRFRSVVVVTSSDHSRRVSRALHRALKGQTVTLIVRPSRYSKFDPENWWQTRENLKTGIIELQKLFIDFVLHPIS